MYIDVTSEDDPTLEGKIVVPLPGGPHPGAVHDFFIYRVDLAGRVSEAVRLMDGEYHWMQVPDWTPYFRLRARHTWLVV